VFVDVAVAVAVLVAVCVAVAVGLGVNDGSRHLGLESIRPNGFCVDPF